MKKSTPGSAKGNEASADARKWKLAGQAHVIAVDALRRVIRVDPSMALGAFHVALSELGNSADCTRDAPYSPAYEMAMTGIFALVTRDAASLESARQWNAHRRGLHGPDSQPLAILDIANAVDMAVHMRKCRNGPPYGAQDPRDRTSYEKLAQGAAPGLRKALTAMFGESVPSVDELADWLDRHSVTGKRGKVTTASIVAHIMNRGKLLGEQGQLQKTLTRVTKALERHRNKRAATQSPIVRPTAGRPRDGARRRQPPREGRDP